MLDGNGHVLLDELRRDPLCVFVGEQRVKSTAGKLSSFRTSAAPPRALDPFAPIRFSWALDVGYGHTLSSRNIP